jgi:hypothetical protein
MLNQKISKIVFILSLSLLLGSCQLLPEKKIGGTVGDPPIDLSKTI